MPCVEQDDALILTLQNEVFHPAEKAENAAESLPAAPQRLSDIPQGLLRMTMDSASFFQTAYKSPFLLTMFLAFVALVPSKLGEAMRIEELYASVEKMAEQNPVLAESYKILMETPLEARFAGGCITAIIQILLLDLLLFACIRGVSHSKLTFKEVGSTLHYSMIPLLLTGIGTIYDVPVVSFIGLCLMIITLTTAVRVSTKCSFGQGIAIMLIFIFLTNITGLLRFFGI